jgi:hypothetical protein
MWQQLRLLCQIHGNIFPEVVFIIFFGLCGCPAFLFVGVKLLVLLACDTGEAYPPAPSEAVLWIPFLGPLQCYNKCH